MPVTVLCIGDLSSLSFSLTKALSENCYEVTTVPTREAALEMAAKRDFDLVLVEAATAGNLQLNRDWPVVFLGNLSEGSFGVLLQAMDSALQLHVERKRNLELLKRLERLAEERDLIINNIPDGIIHSGPDFHIDFKSQPYLAQMGLERSSRTSESPEEVAEVLHPEDRGVLKDIFAAIAAKKAGLDYRFRVKHGLGHYFWREDRARFIYNEQGEYRGAYVICRDATERVASEVALRENYQRLEVIMDTAKIAWWELDYETGKVTFSEHKTQMLGYQAANFTHYNDFVKLLHPDDYEPAMAAMRDHLQGKKAVYDYTYRILAQSGAYLWFHDIGTQQVVDPLTGKRIIAGIVIDVTQQKAAEAAILEQERLSLVRQVTAAVAHDLNNSLQAIVGNADLALIRPENDAKMTRYLSAIKSLAYDTSRRIKPLGQLAGNPALEDEVTVVDLNAIVRETVEQTQPLWKDLAGAAPSESALVMNLSSRRTLDGSRAALRTILLNLIKNAVESMPGGGRITFETTDLEDSISLKISDTGTGMDESIRARIFQPYFTTKGVQSGRGLGMSSVHSLVREQHGRIQVLASAPGLGSTIELVFPFSKDPNSPVLPVSSEVSVCLRILWLDDDEQIRKTGSELLRSLGHTVDLAAEGRAALELTTQQRYDLILTDLGMKGLNGWDFIERARASGVQSKIVLLTAWGQYITDQQVQDQALFGLLAKPVGMTELKALIQRVVESE